MIISKRIVVRVLLASLLMPIEVFAGKGRSGKEITWSSNKIIDGLNNDWDALYSYSDDKAKIQYAFANDSVHLYITIKTSEPIVQTKILSGGMITWIDTNGKKGTGIGIAFPLHNANNEEFKMPKEKANNSFAPGKHDAPDISEMMNNRVAKAKIMQLIGFNQCSGQVLIREQNNCGIEVGLLYNELGELVYEASIPLKAISTNLNSGSAISIGFDITELQKPKLPERPVHEGGPQGMSRGGNASFGGMGGGGNMPPPGNGGHRGMGGPEIDTKAFEATTTWTKIILAAKPN